MGAAVTSTRRSPDFPDTIISRPVTHAGLEVSGKDRGLEGCRDRVIRGHVGDGIRASGYLALHIVPVVGEGGELIPGVRSDGAGRA